MAGLRQHVLLMCGVVCLTASGGLFIYSTLISPAVMYVRAWAAHKPAAPTPIPTPQPSISPVKPAATPKPARQSSREPVKPKAEPQPAMPAEQTLIVQDQAPQVQHSYQPPPAARPTPEPETRLTYQQCENRIGHKEVVASTVIPPECLRQYEQHLARKRDEDERRQQAAEQARRERRQREDAERSQKRQDVDNVIRGIKGIAQGIKGRQ